MSQSTPMPPIATVILAAGHGTRMKSSTPKVLHEVGRRPMLHHVLELGRSIGVARQVVVVGAGGERVADSARAFVPDVRIAVQDPPQGTGHAVQMALPELEGFDGAVAVLYADTPMIRQATLVNLLARVDRGAQVSVLGFRRPDPGAYGRLILDTDGQLDRIVEFKDASEQERAETLCNAGLMAAPASVFREWLPQLGNDNAQGEYYLTDLPGLVRGAGGRAEVVEATEDETAGVNSRAELAVAEATFQTRRRQEMLDAGVTLHDRDTVYFAADTDIGPDVVIGPNVVFGPGVTVGTCARIEAFCHLEGATVDEDASIGPFARLRPGTTVGEGARIGNFVEAKNAAFGPGAKAGHLSYLGDCAIGEGANIGAGTITCNYDGTNKHRTGIGAGAFIGSNSSLVAPVEIADGAYVGSGSVITKDVPQDSLSVARGRQIIKEGWAATFRAKPKNKTGA